MIECVSYSPIYEGLRAVFPHPDAILKHATTLGQSWPLIAILGDAEPTPLFYGLYAIFAVKSNPDAFRASARKWKHASISRCPDDPWIFPPFKHDMRIYYLHAPREVICECGAKARLVDSEEKFDLKPMRPLWMCPVCESFVETKTVRRTNEAPDIVPLGRLLKKEMDLADAF